MARSREGSVYQRHDHASCPPEVDGVRQEHRCRGRWIASVDMGSTVGVRRRRIVYAATEREAIAARKSLLRERDAGTLGADCTVAQWLAHWLDVIAPERAAPRTVANYRAHVDHWIAPVLGHLRLSQVRPEDIRRLRAHLEVTPKVGSTSGALHSPSTVRAVLVTLTAALTAAERERRISWNPATVVPKPSAGQEHHDWLTTEQARAVITAARDLEEQARHAVALYAGLRQGEALALTWADIDLDARTITVTRSAVPMRDGSGAMAIKPTPKNRWSMRVVPMHTLVASTLAAWRAESVGQYVFGGESPTHSSTDYRRWRAACRRAGVPEVPLHGARATTASMLREAGVPLSTIGEILGHRPGSQITGLAYAHSQHAELAGAIAALEG